MIGRGVNLNLELSCNSMERGGHGNATPVCSLTRTTSALSRFKPGPSKLRVCDELWLQLQNDCKTTEKWKQPL